MTVLVVGVQATVLGQPEAPAAFSLHKILAVFIYGTAQTQYWYIPFIALVFGISPLLLKIPKKIFFKMTLCASLIPLLGTRTGIHVSVGQYLYFFPVYLLGMYVAMDYERCIAFIKRRKNTWLFLALTASIALLCLQGKGHYVGAINITESFYYIQKLSLSFLVITALQKFEHANVPVLDSLATYSFAIYFTHLLIGNSFVKKYYYHFFIESPLLIYPASIVYVLIVTCATLIVCMGIKKILGKQARFLIGA
jgi:hypothetical protein